MTPELIALGRRAVACKGWRWMAGMLPMIPAPDGEWYADQRIDSYSFEAMLSPAGGLPDLSDPATLGCLCRLTGLWTDDAKALVAALEAAP